MAEQQWIDWKPQPGDTKPAWYRFWSRSQRGWVLGVDLGNPVSSWEAENNQYQILAPVATPAEDRPPWIDPQCKFRWGDRVRDKLGRVWFVIHPHDKDAAKYTVVIAKSLSTAAPYATEQDLKALGLWWDNPVDACTETAIELFPEDLPKHFDDRILDADQPQESVNQHPVRVPREIWVNTYPGMAGGAVHETRETADILSATDRIECIHFREVL